MIVVAYYLLKVIICSAVLFGYYWLALRNKVFHQYNRFYLLAAVALSLLLPVIKINFWENSTAAKPAVIKVLQAVSDGDVYLDNIVVNQQAPGWTMTDWATMVYFITSVVMLLLLFQTLFVIYRLLKKYPRQQIGDIALVNTDAKSTPFSFLNFIFWNRNIDAESATGKQIFKHEVAHIQEKHSYDKLFINMVLTVFWCNPVFWLLRRELNMIHEFIADKKAVEDSDTASFAAMILQAAYPQHQFSLANNFFYSPIKRRLTMLMKNNNPKVSYWGRVLVLPLAVVVFAAFTFKAKKQAAGFGLKEKIIVVIDAGHGGNDLGAQYESYANGVKNPSIAEKEITLAIAKKVRELNNNAAIEIILTREDDVYMSPKEKADFAKAKNAGLLVSIHMEAAQKPNQKSGLTILVSRDEFVNSEPSKVFASACIETFQQNYPLDINANPVQRNKGVWILQDVSIPAVLIEPGVINNYNDVKYISTEEGKTTIAKNILAAIEKFSAAKLQAGNTVPQQENAFAETMVNMQHSDTNYLKSGEYKNHALIILDDKEIGNYGADYLERNNIRYNSIVVYSPAEAIQKFGIKGKHGVIKLTKNSVVILKADSVFVDDNTNEVRLRGNKTQLDGSLADALIYIDGKEATARQLKETSSYKIASVNIVKGEKLDDITAAKGKKSVIYVSLKPEPLQEVVVQGYARPLQQGAPGEQLDAITADKTVVKPDNLQEVVVQGYRLQPRNNPLYVVNGQVQAENFNLNSIHANDIEQIDVLKDKAATGQYGEKGKNGVIIITTKTTNPSLKEVVATGQPLSLAVNKTGIIYIGVINKLFAPSDNEKYDYTLTIQNGSISGGDGYSAVKVNGVNGLLTVTILKKGTSKVLYNLRFKAQVVPDNFKEVPVIKLDDFIKEKAIL